jgi:hypothetical protein
MAALADGRGYRDGRSSDTMAPGLPTPLEDYS